MNGEDFHQIFLDFLQIEAERHERIMAQASDLLTKITSLQTLVSTIKSDIDVALADMAATGAAGHSAVLDTIAVPLDELMTTVNTFGADVKAKIKAMPVPGAGTVNG